MTGLDDAVKLLIEHGADLSLRYPEGQTVLHLAAMNDRENATTLLLQQGADPNATNRDGFTALHSAADHGSAAALKVLIAHPSGQKLINKPVRDGRYPLHLAAQAEFSDRPRTDYLSVTRLLLENGAQVNVQDDKFRSTPLHLAASSGETEIVKLLVSFQADLEAVNDAGLTPHAWALRAIHLELADWLETMLENHRTP